MTVTSPNFYRKEARNRGIPLQVVERALEYAEKISSSATPVLTLGHLCHYTGAPYKYLRDIIGKHRDPYRIFYISKRSGGKRLITVPEPVLLTVQRWLANNVFSKISPHSSSAAFHPGSSIVGCARQHCGARWLVKMDITNFFESIDEVQVYHCIRDHGFPALVAFEISRLVTRVGNDKFHQGGKWERKCLKEYVVKKYNAVSRMPDPAGAALFSAGSDEFIDTPIRYGHLPQGAPTSPLLANLVMLPLDEHIARLAHELGFIFNRYADDLIFSTDQDGIERKTCTKLIGRVTDLLLAHGFAANQAKTNISPPGARKIVLGLLVDRDDNVRLTKQFKSRLRNHVRNIEAHGALAHANHLKFVSAIGMQRHVFGLLSYAKSVEPDFAMPLIEIMKRHRIPL